MRLTLEFDGVQVRGNVSLRQPLVWPVWFAVDGDAMRALLGDVTAPAPVHAPGPQTGTDVLAWDRTLVPSGLPEATPGVGLALLYTEGGASNNAALAQYKTLIKRVHQMALDAAAEASGLAPLLTFRSGKHPVGIRALTSGFELDEFEAQGSDEDVPDDDPDAAFALVAKLLARVAPGSSVKHTEVPPPEIHRPVADLPTLARPVRPTLPGLVTRPRIRRPRVPSPVFVDGTVASSFVQFWPTTVVATREVTHIRRSLPVNAKLRRSLRTSLTLSGLLRREK